MQLEIKLRWLIITALLLPQAGLAQQTISATGSPAPTAISLPDSQPQPPLRDYIRKEATPATLQDGTIESFFQIQSPASSRRGYHQFSALKVPNAAQAAESRSGLQKTGRALYHILDNAGIPLPIKHESYIAPEIGESYVIPSPQLPKEKKVAQSSDNPASEASQPPLPNATTSQIMLQKIPESELQGLNLTGPRDDTHAPTP